MKIGNTYIKKAKTIFNILNNKSYNKEYFDRLLTIYDCRIFGICFYRSIDSFDSIKNIILNINTENKNIKIDESIKNKMLSQFR